LTADTFKDIEKLESDLWDPADNIFLRHATNRYIDALREIHAEQAAGKMPWHPLTAANFKKRRARLPGA
jgi:type I restriction enzyme M protein